MEKLINKDDRFFVAGHRGMAGSAICRALQRSGYENLLSASRDQLDLLDLQAVQHWFDENKPTVVVLAAAKVGGIHANDTYPADFLLQNLKIQTNVIETAWRGGVKRLLFLGSSCIYPKFADQPIKEEALLTGALEPTNEWYAIAKIAGIKLCESLRKQYGFDAISLMPTNLYGPGDNYHPENSHVLPALIRRFHEAKKSGADSVTCWGTGTPLREFLHVDDLGEACVFALESWKPDYNDLHYLNVGTGNDVTIKELAQAVARATDFQGKIIWDKTKPDGTPKKQLDVSRLKKIGWSASITLSQGLPDTVSIFSSQVRRG
ncbi:GDP-L-fucose synthase [Synechococcus sp. RS9902]|uniref:GDP-L-fucose synthase family protein n=1 Tax=Synechococcus sp. RS9902 TaxID=221345 RepID=UPI0016450F2D|nr:GDP-L-fucose synthase [Synechococcus sp. RS9902]QNI96556.1 GDP-L-fucose synthase [Synechococcus sp. RS9902]